MVYKTFKRLPSRFNDHCQNILQKNRPISVGANIEQKPWTPTERRGRIVAESLPGKPSYKAVPPLLGPNIVDSKKKSSPAYSIGRKIVRRQNLLEEGPAKYNVAGVYNKGMHRSPAFTIKSRTTDVKKWSGPGAAQYEIKSAYEATAKTVPTYSFGKKPVAIKSLPTPAPNVYNLPPIFGTAKEGQIKAAPAFSLIGRDKPRQIPAVVLPGPGQYEDNSRYFHKVTPKYSMHIKHKVISDEHMKPGPGAYCPEKCMKHKSVPAPSFSIRHTPYLGQKKIHLIPESTNILVPSRPEWVL